MPADFRILMGLHQEGERSRKSQVIWSSLMNSLLLTLMKNNLKKSTLSILEDRANKGKMKR